jgi:hypothetical protein
MEVGQGPNWGCSAKGGKKLLYIIILNFVSLDFFSQRPESNRRLNRFYTVLTMVCKTRDYGVFGLRPSLCIPNNTTFRKLVCFRP